MAEEKQFLKPQSPIQDGEDYILPITSYDQILMPDGVSRWDGVSGSEAKVTVNDIEPDDNQNISLSASDVGARSDDWVPAIEDIEGLSEAISNAGQVKTVAGISPDENGDVAVTPSSIGALCLGEDEEVIDGTTTVPINATTLNGMTFDQLKAAIMAEAVYQ